MLVRRQRNIPNVDIPEHSGKVAGTGAKMEATAVIGQQGLGGDIVRYALLDTDHHYSVF